MVLQGMEVEDPIKINLICLTRIEEQNSYLGQILKRGFSGPGFCIFYRDSIETTNHIFFSCLTIRLVWRWISHFLHIPLNWASNLEHNINLWSDSTTNNKEMSIYIVWEIWHVRNQHIFEGQPIDTSWICFKAISWMTTLPQGIKIPRSTTKRKDLPTITLPTRWFDGTLQLGMCGRGEVLKLNRNTQYNLSWNRGLGTNSRAEIIALWGLL